MKKILFISLVLFAGNLFADTCGKSLTGPFTAAQATSVCKVTGSAVNHSLVPSANSTYDLGSSTLGWQTVYAAKGVADNISTLAAAGSTIADGGAITTTLTRVTGADGTKGVVLPALSTIAIGRRLTVINSDTTNALKVYGNAAGELIDGQAGNTAVSVAAKLWLECIKYDSTNWYCAKTVTPF